MNRAKMRNSFLLDENPQPEVRYSAAGITTSIAAPWIRSAFDTAANATITQVTARQASFEASEKSLSATRTEYEEA